MSGHASPSSSGGGNAAPPTSPVPVAVTSATIISPETKEEIKKGHWGHFFKLAAVDLGLFGLILVLNEVYGKIKMSKEHRDHVEAARKHAQKGEFSQAYESLKRLPFGVGLNDEEMFDESLMEAAKHQGASEKELRSLEVFLASDVRYRKAFRNALTRQNDAEKRAKLVAVYAKLNDEHRKIRLLAVGKMDPAEAEEFLYACAEAAVNTFHDVNVLLAQWEERRRKNWFVRAARFCIR